MLQNNLQKMMPFFKDFFPSSVYTYISQNDKDYKQSEDNLILSSEQTHDLNAATGLYLEQVVNIKQVHGKLNIIVDEKFVAAGYPVMEADGIITSLVNQPIAIRTADCLSVFLHDQKNNVIALVHAGWKGTQQNITGQAIENLKMHFGSHPDNIRAAFGPAIGLKSCEVTDEFLDYFPDETVLEDEKLFFNVAAANRRQLLNKNIKEENIFDCGIDTYEDDRYFSFREEGDAAGRMIHLMMLKD